MSSYPHQGHAALSNPSIRVIQTVAREESVSPVDLSPPLANVIDPEALDSLVEDGEGLDEGFSSLTFRYHGYDVTVDADGDISTERCMQ